MCRLCKTQEEMEDFNDSLSEDYEPPKMKLMYSVSRGPRQMETINKDTRAALVKVANEQFEKDLTQQPQVIDVDNYYRKHAASTINDYLRPQPNTHELKLEY